MKRNLAWLIVFSLVCFFLFPVASNKARAQNYYTPEDYINYLQNYSIDDALQSGVENHELALKAVERAKVTLEQFKKLSKHDQEDFISLITNPTTAKAIYSGDIDKLDSKIQKKVKWTKVAKTAVSEIELSSDSMNVTASSLSSSSAYRIVTNTGTMWVLGIPVTEYVIEGKYYYNSDGVTSVIYTKAYVSHNYNPAVVTDKVWESGYVSNKKYYGDAMFYYKIGLGSIGLVQLGNVYIGVVGNKNGVESGYFYTK